MPEFVARCRVESLNIVVITVNEKDAIVDQGRRFVGAGRQRQGSGGAKVLYVLFGDLF